MFENIIYRVADSSYVIDKNGYPFHVPNEGEWAELWQEVNAYALANPNEVTIEEPYVPEPMPEPVIQSISPRQARLQLLKLSHPYDTSKTLLDAVEAMIVDMGREAGIEWEFAGSVDRTHPLVVQLVNVLGWSDEMLNDFIAQASKL